jgi:hypothetical protein
MKVQNYFIPIKELAFFCFFIQFAYLCVPVISNQANIAARVQASGSQAPASQITTIISITTR